MSTDGIRKKRRINLEKVEEFFTSIGASAECPICSNPVWQAPNSESIGGNAVPWGTGSGDMFATGLPVLVMICTKCKFVRQHSLLNDDIPGALEEF